MYTWSLKDLYDGYGEAYQKDFKRLKDLIEKLTSLSLELNTKDDLENWLVQTQTLNKTARTIGAFISLQLSTDATDTKSNQEYGQLQNVLTALSKPEARFNLFLSKHKEDFKQWVNESPIIKEHEFILQEAIDQAQYNLSEDVEETLSKMAINASSAWNQLHGHLTSLTTCEFDGKTHTLTSLRNLAYSSDQDLRKRAYEKELELYTKMEDSIAFSLNSIKGEVNQTSKMRGYDSAIEKTLMDSRMSQKTLDALMGAIKKYTPEFRRYLKHKAKLLGHTNGLPWYDLFAPFEVKNPKVYSVEDSRTLILDSFYDFSDDLGDLAKEAYDNDWIDFLPREGKRGGAFCNNLPQIKQSRVMTNFDGSTSAVITLAHELGHAYHGKKIQDFSILNTGYTMPVAETASTFCENIVLNASLKTASDDEKLVLIENSIQDLTQIVVDIASRYQFETEVFKQNQDGFLFPKDLKAIMIQAQKDTYGDGLDENALHPYMWVNKGHYYRAGLSYYNFPYAFGGLFALGLMAKYEKDGDDFIPQYEALLSATTTASCEDVAKMADIDVEDQAFWDSSLDQVVKRIDDFIQLTS